MAGLYDINLRPPLHSLRERAARKGRAGIGECQTCPGSDRGARGGLVHEFAATVSAIVPNPMSQSQHKTISEGGRNDGSTESSRLPISQQAMGTIRTPAQIPSAGKGGAMLKFQDKLIFGWVLVTIGLMAFAPETSQSQGGRVKNSTKPTVSSISPTSATAGGASFTLTVVGTNFVSGALVQWVGSTTGSISTTLVSSSQLQAMIPSTLLTAAGTVQVSVYDPGKGG